VENLHVAQGAKQGAGDKTGAHRGRHLPAAARDATRTGRQPKDHADPGRSDWNSAASSRRKRRRPHEYGPPRGPANPIIVTLLVGLAAEVVLPWAAIWLSDMLVIDMPTWSLWLVFGVPPALTFLAVLIQWTLRAWLCQPLRATVPTQQE
jgi:hypothetical protein